MRKKIAILVSILLLFLCSCVDNERVIEDTPPMEEISPLPELDSVPSISDRPSIGDVIPNKQPQIVFDESSIDSIREYFKLQGNENLWIRLVSSSRNLIKLEIGDNPKVEISLYNQNSISTRTQYVYSKGEYTIQYRCMNTQMSCDVNIGDLAFKYDGTTNSKVFTTVDDESLFMSDEVLQDVFEESLQAFQLERDTNSILDSKHLKMVQQMLLSSYFVQDTLIDEDTLTLIQPILIQSQLFELPISYVHNASSLWIMGDMVLHIFVDAYNHVSGTYYVQEVVPMEYEYMGQWITRDVVLSCDRGVFMVSLEGDSSFNYSYQDGGLLLNGYEYFSKLEEEIFLESILPKMVEFYDTYNENCPLMEQLIQEIKDVLED